MTNKTNKTNKIPLNKEILKGRVSRAVSLSFSTKSSSTVPSEMETENVEVSISNRSTAKMTPRDYSFSIS